MIPNLDLRNENNLLKIKHNLALAFNHGLDMLVKLTDLMIAVCL